MTDLGTTPVSGPSSSAKTKTAGLDSLTIQDFARLFGANVGDLSAECREMVSKHDFTFRRLSAEEREQTILNVLKKVDSNQFSLAGKEGKPRWDKGWGENLDAFVQSGGDVTKLVPKYIRPNQAIRLDQNYVMPTDPEFELNWYNIFRKHMFQTYLRDFDNIYEFGCGSAFNLAVLAQMYPEKRIFGMDWAKPSADIADKMAEIYGWKTKGHVFDFFNPDYSLKIAPNSAVLTVGALEQTGRDWGAFLEYLLKSKPALVLHIEPICEWYDENNLVDYAAIRFHQQRKYWQGYPEKIKELEREGKVEVLKTERAYFGSLYLEGYSRLIWRPKNLH